VLHTALDEPIIFRDITPSNIIITDEGDVKLGDFGLTRYFNPQKLKDTFVMGTPGFSPPEQYGKGQSDERSDIYSLGATLFYSLTLHCVEEFTTTPPLRKLNPLLPGAVEKVILTSIQKDPKKRQQTAKQFKEDLEKCRK
jgi:serine/threonine-protein kinase